MAMIPKRRTSAIAGVLALLLAGAGAWELRALSEIRAYNAALQRGDYVGAAGLASPHGRFAKAYGQARKGRLEEAIRAYVEIENAGDPALLNAARYNRANLYLLRAEQARDEPDLAVPLIELAKRNYRELLYAHSADWDAKYNLERALRLLPDELGQDLPAPLMPQRSQGAAGAISVHRELP
jgi:mxaK protein